jgi:hypothetical protein
MRYHNYSEVNSIANTGTATIEFKHESLTACAENVAVWIEAKANVTWQVLWNGVNAPATSSGTYTAGTGSPQKVWTESGPMPIERVYPSIVITNNSGGTVVVRVTWVGLIRQPHG